MLDNNGVLLFPSLVNGSGSSSFSGTSTGSSSMSAATNPYSVMGMFSNRTLHRKKCLTVRRFCHMGNKVPYHANR